MGVELMARMWERVVSSEGSKRSPYKSGWTTIVKALRYELGRIGVAQAIIELDVRDHELRNDGWIRSDARPSLPGVRVSFTCEYGRMMYECGTWTSWEHNIFAIARTLRAQRLIARDGAVKGDQIYKGFKALPASGEASCEWNSPREAAEELAKQAGMQSYDAAIMLRNGNELNRVYRLAAARNHPDRGGDAAIMGRVNRARDFIEKASAA